MANQPTIRVLGNPTVEVTDAKTQVVSRALVSRRSDLLDLPSASQAASGKQWVRTCAQLSTQRLRNFGHALTEIAGMIHWGYVIPALGLICVAAWAGSYHREIAEYKDWPKPLEAVLILATRSAHRDTALIVFEFTVLGIVLCCNRADLKFFLAFCAELDCARRLAKAQSTSVSLVRITYDKWEAR